MTDRRYHSHMVQIQREAAAKVDALADDLADLVGDNVIVELRHRGQVVCVLSGELQRMGLGWVVSDLTSNHVRFSVRDAPSASIETDAKRITVDLPW